MLVSHINAIEKILLAQSNAAENAGHPNLRGGPREWFIRDFLENHLPANLEIGHGEIIDRNSKPSPSPGEYRPEVDIVIYRRDLPKISYSKDNTAYLVEGVVATIESKTRLKKRDLKQACEASIANKSMKRNIVSYVFAYDGPKNILTVGNWLPKISQELRVSAEQLVEMIIILGKGVIWNKDKFFAIPSDTPENDGSDDDQWIYFEQHEKNLFVLFTHLLSTVATILKGTPDTLRYGFQFRDEPYGTIMRGL
jgi:hypothetical protein